MPLRRLLINHITFVIREKYTKKVTLQSQSFVGENMNQEDVWWIITPEMRQSEINESRAN